MEERFELQIFSNPEFGELELIIVDNKTYVAATEVAKMLKYAKPESAISRHCRYPLKRRVWVQTGIKKDGTPAMRETEKFFISEGDIYRLIVNSQLPKAQEIEKWIFDEVLPTLYKTGRYSVPQLSQNELILKIAQSNVEMERRVNVIEETQTALITQAVETSNKVKEIEDRLKKTNFILPETTEAFDELFATPTVLYTRSFHKKS